MQINLNNRKLAYDIIEEVCKEVMNDNKILLNDSNIVYSLREDWCDVFEHLSVNNNFHESYSEDYDYDDVTEKRGSGTEFSDESEYDEDSDIKKAEKYTQSYFICLFVKVIKSKGKWKCIFKDGFINIDGREDQPFNNASGELEW